MQSVKGENCEKCKNVRKRISDAWTVLFTERLCPKGSKLQV